MSASLTLSASWPLPQAADIAGAYCASYQAAFPGCDPYQDNTVMAVQARTHGIVGFGLYLYQRSLADELMLDTAQVWLPRHADQWGVPRIPPSFAIGNLIFAGPPNLPLPQGIEVVGNGGFQWITTAPATVGAGNTVSVPVIAETAGAGGNCAAGTQLTIISPVIGLQNQVAIVDANGLAGGADIEPIEAWRARIKLRVRKRGDAGDDDDYIEWAEAAGAAPSPQVLRSYAGAGTVGVAVAMPNPAAADRLVATAAQVAAIAASIERVRPITAQVIVFAAVQLTQPLTVALSPDTVVGRARAAAAAQAYLAGLPIGGLAEHSWLEDAMLQASGAAVELSLPAADVQAPTGQMFIMGPVNFVSYT